jgi:hypothetical protein
MSDCPICKGAGMVFVPLDGVSPVRPYCDPDPNPSRLEKKKRYERCDGGDGSGKCGYLG